MLQIFSKSCIGYSHIKNKKVCQDYTSHYHDNDRTIITCADGHGGDLYVRSHIGAQVASCAIINVFSSITLSDLRRITVKEFCDKIRLEVLCEWNRQIESHIAKYPIRKSEIEHLEDEKKELLKKFPVKAYGTTLAGAMVLNNKLIVVSIGDTEVLGIQKGELIKFFDYDDDPAANITNSMCQEDAYNYLRVKIYDFKLYDGVLLCSDGLSSPYQSYVNFKESFVKPLMKRIINGESLSYVSDYVVDMALRLGIGDDVSLSFIINDKAFKKYYN